MTERIARTIDAARRSFNKELLSADYQGIHDDEEQVGRLVAFLDPRPGGTYLDLATGNGAVAFALADRQTESRVIGIDIADQAVMRNRNSAAEKACRNIAFRQTDGREIDFPTATFDGVACRYALHHFPDVDATLSDVRRVLKPDGTLALADAIRYPGDDEDFINRFQALKPDGHVRIHSVSDLVQLFLAHGFEVTEQFGSAITFTRDLNQDYRRVIGQTAPEILRRYAVEVVGDQARLTFGVENFKLVTSCARGG